MNNEEKAKRITKKIDDFMVDLGAEMLDPEVEKSITDQVKRVFRVSELGISRMTLKSFKEGVSLALHLVMRGGGNQADAAMLLGTVTKMIHELEAKTKKQLDALTPEQPKV